MDISSTHQKQAQTCEVTSKVLKEGGMIQSITEENPMRLVWNFSLAESIAV